MKYEAKPPKEIKTKTKVEKIVELILWIASAIISLSYVYTRAYSSIAFLSVNVFWLTMIGFYIYDKSCKKQTKFRTKLVFPIVITIILVVLVMWLDGSRNKEKYQNAKAEYAKGKMALNKVDSLPEKDKKQLIELGVKLNKINLSHLNEQDKIIYSNLINATNPTDAEIDEMKRVLKQINSNLTPEERKTSIEFQKLRQN